MDGWDWRLLCVFFSAFIWMMGGDEVGRFVRVCIVIHDMRKSQVFRGVSCIQNTAGMSASEYGRSEKLLAWMNWSLVMQVRDKL